MKERDLNTLYVDFEHLADYDEVRVLSSWIFYAISLTTLFLELLNTKSIFHCRVSLRISHMLSTVWSPSFEQPLEIL